MKKLVFSFIIFFVGLFSVLASEKITVKFSSCVDGDTAKFVYKDEVITARFLAIDTPETKHPKKGEEPYGKEASEYTCNKLTNAKKIVLEFDKESDKKDKYDRYLVWVFVDNELLQKELVSKGLASVAYLYGDYKYTEELELIQQDAEEQKLGIWSIKEESVEEKKDLDYYIHHYKETVILIGIVIIMCIFSSKARNKVKRKAKAQLKKEIKKRL